MLETHLRQAAAALLETAIRVAPPETQDWGKAMLGELTYVQGRWAAVMWAAGGASVLAKHALASLLFPGRRGQGVEPGGGLFARSVPLRKVALVTSGACVLVALVFFAAPPFRQAFRVALKPFQIASGDIQPGYQALAKRAETQHDAEGLAFCAVRIKNPGEAARLAEEAVRLDPNLLWVCAVVAMRHPGLPQAGEWSEKLKRWDPRNALPHLTEAESIRLAQLHQGTCPPACEQNQAWRSAMAAAFQSPKFDAYLDRIAELNRRVVPRYRFYDPYEVESRELINLPVAAFENSERFAKSLLREGGDLEARGDRKGARDKYWAVERFGQVIDSQGRADFEHLTGTSLEAMACKQLRTSFEKEGNREEADFFGYLAAKFDTAGGKHSGFPMGSVFERETARRNAAVVQISVLMFLAFSGLVLVAASVLIAGRHRGAKQRARPVATLAVLTGAVGLLFTSVTLYLTYRPYWYIFQHITLNGGGSQTRDLMDFLNYTKAPPGVSPHGWLSPGMPCYFWTGVILLGLIGLALVVLRHFLGRPHSSPAP